jgi:glutathione S-transferase
MHYAEGSLMPLLLMKLVFKKVKTEAPLLIRPIARAIAGRVSSGFLDPGLAAHLAFLLEHLGKHPWFAGDDFTIADIQMSFAIEAAIARVEGANSPKLTDWLARIKGRPAYRRAIERGGEYSIDV